MTHDFFVSVPLRAVSTDGKVFWWTGKAGAAWVSPDRSQAHVALSLEGARRKALQFNKMSALHGLYFVAVSGND